MAKILLIEDDAEIRESFIEFLETEHFECLSAANGIQGLQLAQKYQPDLIICDIMMPQLDGYDVLNELQKNSLTAMIPFIFLSAKDQKEDFRRGMKLGADDYLSKPCTPEELLKAIFIRLEKHTKYIQKQKNQIIN